MAILTKVVGWIIDCVSSVVTVITLPVVAIIILTGCIIKPMRQVFVDLATLMFVIPAALDAFAESLRHGTSFVSSYNGLMDNITDRICGYYQ